MIGSYSIHTDLALEDKERFEADQIEVAGVSLEKEEDKENEIEITRVKIMTENGAKTMGKPVGTYITMEIQNLMVPDERYQRLLAGKIAEQIKTIINIKQTDYTALVVGLGNREVTPDALGPCVVDELKITRHIIKEYGKYAMDKETVRLTSALAPGVMAQTGMESLEIVKGIAESIKPDVIFVIDALAARSTKRLNRTIQISDAGIHPGAGIGNHRSEISKATLGVPVIAIGVPTVVDAATIVKDTVENLLMSLDKEDRYEMLQELISPQLYGMFVTPKDIDEAIERIGKLIAEALNIYLA